MANPRLCSVPDCGKRHHSNNYCRQHSRRFLDHGDPLGGKAANGEPLAWLKDHVGHQGEGCLIWPFSMTDKGYAKFQNRGAYRVMCEMAHGEPPSVEHEAAHTCGRGVDACVHPGHLRWATKSENSADRIEHGTAYVGESGSNAKLTAEQVVRIRELKGRMRQKDIADRFGISQSHAGRILREEAWIGTWGRDRI